MSTTSPGKRAHALRDLRELVAALDRRVPQVERAGEVGIARAAAALRSEAMDRIAEIETGSPSGDTE